MPFKIPTFPSMFGDLSCHRFTHLCNLDPGPMKLSFPRVHFSLIQNGRVSLDDNANIDSPENGSNYTSVSGGPSSLSFDPWILTTSKRILRTYFRTSLFPVSESMEAQ